MSNNSWVIDVDENGVMTFPEEVILELNWQYGDVIEWTHNQNGTFTLRKVDNSSEQV